MENKCSTIKEEEAKGLEEMSTITLDGFLMSNDEI
jgi:hypothetical protein